MSLFCSKASHGPSSHIDQPLRSFVICPPHLSLPLQYPLAHFTLATLDSSLFWNHRRAFVHASFPLPGMLFSRQPQVPSHAFSGNLQTHPILHGPLYTFAHLFLARSLIIFCYTLSFYFLKCSLSCPPPEYRLHEGRVIASLNQYLLNEEVVG